MRKVKQTPRHRAVAGERESYLSLHSKPHDEEDDKWYTTGCLMLILSVTATVLVWAGVIVLGLYILGKLL